MSVPAVEVAAHAKANLFLRVLGREADGYHAIENKLEMHDLHATLLFALGLDHEQLTYRHAGRDFRLTDVYGNVVRDIFA